MVRPSVAMALAICVVGLRLADAQTGAVSSGPLDAPVSPAVIATAMYEQTTSAAVQLKLMVLWRGTPGWYMKGNGGSSSAAGGMNESGSQRQTIRISQGGVDLSLQFDAASRVARIGEREVSLTDDNVILVDEVDGSAGPQVIRTLRVDPLVQAPGPSAGRGGKGPLVPPQIFIRRSQELVDYLQCGGLLPDASPYVQQMMSLLCSSLMTAPGPR